MVVTGFVSIYPRTHTIRIYVHADAHTTAITTTPAAQHVLLLLIHVAKIKTVSDITV